jgi:hypothetical protein
MNTGHEKVSKHFIHRTSGKTHKLSRGELRHARVDAVVHEVVDWVHAAAGAGVARCRAARGGGGFRRGVGDGVTCAGAAALEGMVEADPVPSFVGEGLATAEQDSKWVPE